MAEEQVRAFYHSGTQYEKEILWEHFADMIFKNMQSLVDVPMDSMQTAKERSLMRQSLRGLSFEEMQAKKQDSLTITSMDAVPEDSY